MSVVIIVLLLIITGILLTAMAAGFSSLSTPHLRHWARQKDQAAGKLYPLKARGSATLLTIELMRAFVLSGAVVLICIHLSPWFAWLLIALVFFIAFVVLTQLYLKPLGIRLLMWLSGPLLDLTNLLKPVSLPLGRIFDRFLEGEPVTLTRSELSRMLGAVQLEDTDLNTEEIRILSNVLEFSDITVHDIMVPKNKVATIKVTETLSPVILDELHKSGHERFPVMAEDGKTVIGILNMHDLMDIKAHSTVAETMVKKVYFVEEDRDLDHVLQIFYKTKQSVFVVNNTASDMVGIISIEDVVQQILGKPGEHEHAKPATKDKEPDATGEEPLPVVE